MDIETISKMFAPEIVLRDWNHEVSGPEAALAEYSKNFRTAGSLKITVNQIYESKSGIASQLEIVVNDSEKLNVIDVFTFNEANKITSVVAYKGL